MNHFEIEASVVRAKNGNREELQKILEQYKPFIFKTAKTFNIRDFDVNDLVQIGYVTLINAVAKYRPGSHTFSSYAFNAIKNAFRYTARQNNRYNDELSLNRTVDSDFKRSTEYIDCIDSLVSLEEDILKAERFKEIRQAVESLPSEDMEIIDMIYFSGYSLKYYSEKKGIAYLTATRRRKRALEKLNDHLRKFN